MHIHLVGIGGIGLSAIARVLLGLGYTVSGSDQVGSELTDALATERATVFIGHSAENVRGAELVLISSAIPPGNPEVEAAHAAGIPVVKRIDFLAHLMEGRMGIAIAGTHGKTTTTAMVASILEAAGLDPSFIVGGVMADYRTNARVGRGDPFVVEADEYDGMFLGLWPKVAVLTTVEHDHPDCYPTLADMMDAFRQFIAHLPPEGLLVACLDDPGARQLGGERESQGGRVAWYGIQSKALWQAVDLQLVGATDFGVLCGGMHLGVIHLNLPGRHNVLNALASLAVADRLGVSFDSASRTLASFGGVARRFEVKGEVRGVTVVDDYAHHPTKIAVTLKAARDRFYGRRIWVVFQPHTYSRTRALLDAFSNCFGDADEVIVLDIYAAREVDNLGITASGLVAGMAHPRARYIGGRHQAVSYLVEKVQPGDVVLTLGAGDGNKVGEWFLDSYGKLEEERG